MVLTMAPEAKAEGSTYNISKFACLASSTNVITYFLIHVGIQDQILGNLFIFLERFAKTDKVKNLGRVSTQDTYYR